MSTDADPMHSEIFRRIGRNLVLFQQIEQLLKSILANRSVSGTVETYKARQQTQADRINRKTLGQLVDRYGSELLQDAAQEAPEEDRPAGWFSFSFQRSANGEYLESMRRNLKLMTAERNDLVHHFLPRWQPDSAASSAEALAYLDAQRDRVLPAREHFRNTAAHMQRIAELLASPECERQWELALLRASPLVTLLAELATQYCRQDGWTDLGTAGRLAWKAMADEMKNLKVGYGFTSLKRLLIACELFEVFDQPLSRGGFKTLYRNRATP